MLVGKLSPRCKQCTPLHRSLSSLFLLELAGFFQSTLQQEQVISFCWYFSVAIKFRRTPLSNSKWLQLCPAVNNTSELYYKVEFYFTVLLKGVLVRSNIMDSYSFALGCWGVSRKFYSTIVSERGYVNIRQSMW